MTSVSEPTRIAFVCVENAGRSQMAYAFAQRERATRALERDIDLTMGGTEPAEYVHSTVVETMDEVGIDITDRTPRYLSTETIGACDIVITMGCSATEVCPAAWAGESRDWELDDPAGKSCDEVDEIRDQIQRLVSDLFDELQED